MPGSLKELLADQEELAQSIRDKCTNFDQRIESLTPVEQIISEIENALLKCKDKDAVLKSYGDHETIKPYLNSKLMEEIGAAVGKVREKVLDMQSKHIAEVTRIRTNFNKDSKTRKTQAYLERRLSVLEESFALVVDFNDALKLMPIKDDFYYKDDIFNKTKKVYLEMKEDIKALMETTKQADEVEAGTSSSPLESPRRISFSNPQNAKMKIQRIRMQKFRVFLNKSEIIMQEDSKNIATQFLNDASQRWAEIESLDDQIQIEENLAEELYQYDCQYLQLQKAYDDIHIMVQRKLDQLESTSGIRPTHTTKIKLKPIEIRKFDGQCKSWRAFIETFTDAVERANFSNIEKLHYLLDNLENEPRSIISHLQITGSNYEQAIELLRDRFENNRKTVTTYIETILELPNLQPRSADNIIKMHDSLKECIINLTHLKLNVQSWSPVLMTVLLKKLDYETSRVFEESLTNPKELPTLDYFMEFLTKRYKTLDSIKTNKRMYQSYQDTKKEKKVAHIATKASCIFCSGEHDVIKCKSFADSSRTDKFNFVRNKRLCRQCLDHEFIRKCNKNNRCATCDGKHHTLLHGPELTKRESGTDSSEKGAASEIKTTTLYSKEAKSAEERSKITCLPTAQIKVRTQLGDVITLRALIDQGSQTSFITERAAQLLKLPKQRAHIEIYGMGNVLAGVCKYAVNLQVFPRFASEWTTTMEAKVMKKLTINQPEAELMKSCKLLNNITLADSAFNMPGQIDIIIGADYYHEIILPKQKKSGAMIAQETTLGWIISGALQAKGDKFNTRVNTLISHSAIKDLNNQLKKFWEVESMQGDGESVEDDVEHRYSADVRRDENSGRYIVKLPLKPKMEIGRSREQALARLFQTEAKLKNKPQLKKEYNNFLNEYVSLGHMTEVTPNPDAYFLPHHAVLKPESETTKLRVVFDASAITTNRKSLNDIMFTGPNLLQDLMELLIRWRQHKIVITADVEKMFRQITLDKSQRDFQRILWRAAPEDKIKEYQLNTVTYGTAAASFLAIRTLHQLADDEDLNFGKAAQILRRDFYMDDCLSGAQNKEEATALVDDLNQLLLKGGMHLRKWASNDSDVLKNVPKVDKRTTSFDFQKEDSTKTLGIYWSAAKDMFSFKVNYEPALVTKRHILSTVAKIYDPIGWLQPTVMVGKQFMKRVASENLDWDTEVPTEIQRDWFSYANSLIALSEIKIPRWTKHTFGEMEILGFCDASESAYAAAIYAKTRSEDGKIHVSLIAAKGKVAPSKETLTIPKLELKGALLLAQLVAKCTKALQTESTIKLFCDSKIVLAWITGNKTRNDVFVNNRVAQIHELTSKNQWFYVKSNDNPADCATRGLSPAKLKDFQLWWNGPAWVQEPSDKWENYGVQQEVIKEVVQSFTSNQGKDSSKEPVSDDDMWHTILRKFSSFDKTVRVVAWIVRFKENCRNKNANRNPAVITADEWEHAHVLVIQAIQREVYGEEFKALKAGKSINPKSHILKLSPFMDSQQVMRVGGRIQASNVAENFKHPIIMPKHSFTRVLARETHLNSLHGGPQLVLNILRTKYWLVSGKVVVSAAIKSCQKCHRFKSTTENQRMGNLPPVRLLPAPPFAATGIDYAGPFLTKLSTGRTTKTLKTYICVFVCMATKAIHLELVTGLTSEAFLSALRRFTARRGNPKDIYSDNGTNFVGAQKSLAQDYRIAVEEGAVYASNLLASEGVRWHFIPPRTPHFGGLWEAAVKSIKKHLRIELNDKLLSYEEFSTILCRIEACVNSRPLTQLSSEPDDLEALTPGHFLIGRALTAPPEVPSEFSLHKRWDLIKRIQNNFWSRWQKEYMGNLLIRGKWNVVQPNLKIGELVLVKDKTLPPLKWPLARVVKLHEGPDGLVRVVDVDVGKKIKPLSLENIGKLPVDDTPEPNHTKVSKTHVNLATNRSTADGNQPQLESSKPTPRDWMWRPATKKLREMTSSIIDNKMAPWKERGVFTTNH